MFERYKGSERAILVQLALPGLDTQQAIGEFKELAYAAQAQIVGYVVGQRAHPEAKFYVGAGKAEEIKQQVQLNKADLVLVNHELSPSQARNLENFLQCRVVDRSSLILDIFAQRAHTFEGKLQVELAQLQHLSTRLVGGWQHLERQKGGIGLRGPGETQLETDRRLIRARIRFINKRLAKVRSTRQQNRLARKKAGMHVISLVGYTNAGKSTLFNALTGEHSYTASQLFATLDPTMRKVKLPNGTDAILTDTVGFIRDLPHQLIQAFRATLEEICEADLLLHVIDISDPHWRDTIAAVELVLTELNLNMESTPIIRVFNKIDLQVDRQLDTALNNHENKVWVSAKTGVGLDILRELIANKLCDSMIQEEIWLSAEQAKLRFKLYSMHAVISEKSVEDGWRLKIKLTAQQKQRLFSN